MSDSLLGVEIPREAFFKARNFYIQKRMQLKSEMMQRESQGTLTPPVVDTLIKKHHSFDGLEAINGWAATNGI